LGLLYNTCICISRNAQNEIQRCHTHYAESTVQVLTFQLKMRTEWSFHLPLK
jgi:hypothetical protein